MILAEVYRRGTNYFIGPSVTVINSNCLQWVGDLANGINCSLNPSCFVCNHNSVVWNDSRLIMLTHETRQGQGLGLTDLAFRHFII